MQLYNKLSAKEREALIDKAGKDRLTISFYKYAHIGNVRIFRNHLFIHWDELDVLGRIYVAAEGINAQLEAQAGRSEEQGRGEETQGGGGEEARRGEAQEGSPAQGRGGAKTQGRREAQGRSQTQGTGAFGRVGAAT